MLFKRFLTKRLPLKGAATPTNKNKENQRQTPPASPVPDQRQLAEQARHPDPAQRREALKRLLDLALIRHCRDGDADEGVRAQAAARYRALLLGLATPDQAPPDARLAELEHLTDPDTLSALATQCPVPEVRRAAIERVKDPATLAQAALHDGLAANRHLAMEHLEDRAALEEIARQIGKRDKTVYRLAREKLRAIAERELRPQRIREHCQELCEKVERLGRLNNWVQDRALLDHLDRQWAEFEAEAEHDWRERYQAARTRFLTAHAEHLAQEAARATVAPSPEPADEPAPAVTPALQPERTADSEPQAPAPAPADSERQRARLARLCEQLDTLREESRPLQRQSLESQLKRGRALAEALVEGPEVERFASLAERLEARLRHQIKHAEQRLGQFAARLAELEAHLEAGELRKADPLHQSLQAGLELVQASALPAAASAELSERLRELAPRLRELHQWRRWSADQHREQLCAEAEALRDSDQPLEALCERLHGLRKDWKLIDSSGARANQALWERFHQAAEALQARCRPFIEAQAAEREANREAREALCDQIERFVAEVDWERVDWKKLLHAERDMRRAWKDSGTVEARHHRVLSRRFNQSMRTLEKRLDAERRHNQALRRELIARVEALIEEPDLEQAIEDTKTLQRQWHTTVPLRQKEENQLWRQFRAACDAVFARRAARHQAQTEELRQNLAQRTAILEEARERIAQAADARALDQRWREIEQRWRETLDLAVPRAAQSELHKGWQGCREEVEQRRQALQAAEQGATLALLERQAALCERIEQAALEGQPERLEGEALEAEWQRLATQRDAALQTEIEQRFQRALQALDERETAERLRQAQASNARERAQLCLQLEILAGLDSPPEFTQQRLEYQVSRLAERMGEGEADPLSDAAALLQRWHLSGPAPADSALSARYARIREALT
ncbi:MAG: DUF349 domain-containing protein [Chromatiaceae bacterium]|nr:DUF349 domain-containing protein [Chromatiaceae bacterium]